MQCDRFRILIQGDHFVGEALRAGHAWIAQRIVEHILVADFGATRGRVFTQLADHGLSAKHGLVGFVDHEQPPCRTVVLLTHISCTPAPGSIQSVNREFTSWRRTCNTFVSTTALSQSRAGCHVTVLFDSPFSFLDFPGFPQSIALRGLHAGHETVAEDSAPIFKHVRF